MPKATYDVTIDGQTYEVSSDRELSETEAYQYALTQAHAAPTSAAPTTRSWMDVPGEALRNLPASAGRALSGLAAPVLHPVDTATGLASALSHPMQTGGAVLAGMKKRYGSSEGLKQTLSEDPVGALVDAASLLTGGGGLALKAGQVAKVPALAKAGQVAMRAGGAMDPGMAVIRGTARAANVAKRVGHRSAERLGMAAFSPTETMLKTEAPHLAYRLVQEGARPTLGYVKEADQALNALTAQRASQVAARTQAGVAMPQHLLSRAAMQEARTLSQTPSAPLAQVQSARAFAKELATRPPYAKTLTRYRTRTQTSPLVGPSGQPMTQTLREPVTTQVPGTIPIADVVERGKPYSWAESQFNRTADESLKQTLQKALGETQKHWLEGAAPEIAKTETRMSELIPMRNAAEHAAILGERTMPLGWRTLLPFGGGMAAAGVGGLASGPAGLALGTAAAALMSRSGLNKAARGALHTETAAGAAEQALRSVPGGAPALAIELMRVAEEDPQSVQQAAQTVSEAATRVAALPQTAERLQPFEGMETFAKAVTGQPPTAHEARQRGQIVSQAIDELADRMSTKAPQQFLKDVQQTVNDVSLLTGGVAPVTRQRDRAAELAKHTWSAFTTEVP